MGQRPLRNCIVLVRPAEPAGDAVIGNGRDAAFESEKLNNVAPGKFEQLLLRLSEPLVRFLRKHAD